MLAIVGFALFFGEVVPVASSLCLQVVDGVLLLLGHLRPPWRGLHGGSYLGKQVFLLPLGGGGIKRRGLLGWLWHGLFLGYGGGLGRREVWQGGGQGFRFRDHIQRSFDVVGMLRCKNSVNLRR